MKFHSKMAAERFVEYIQNCFNDRFHADMRNTMIAYLKPFDETYVSCLAMVTLKRHPRQFRTAPGLAELEKYHAEAYQEYQRARQDLSVPAITEEAVTDDERQKVVEAIEKMTKLGFSLGEITTEIAGKKRFG